VTHGFPQVPSPLFTSESPFAIENRGGLEHQEIGGLVNALKAGVQGLSDFHLLIFLHRMHVFSKVKFLDFILWFKNILFLLFFYLTIYF